MLCSLGEEVGLKQQLPGLRNGAADASGQLRAAGRCLPALPSAPALSCSHRHFPGTLQLREMLAEQPCLLPQPPKQRGFSAALKSCL